MNDFLVFAISVVLGGLASVPVAMIIAASTTHGRQRRNIHQDLGATWQQPQVKVERPQDTTAVVIFDPNTFEVMK